MLQVHKAADSSGKCDTLVDVLGHKRQTDGACIGYAKRELDGYSPDVGLTLGVPV